MEFKFKKFIIKQPRSAMRVNTDGVLLGAWMNLPNLKIVGDDKTCNESSLHLLDVGTGTGVISLMAAQRIESEQSYLQIPSVDIVGLEIDENSYKDAVDNFANSPWGINSNTTNLKALHCSLQEYSQSCNYKYDFIFSNPPYFINSLKSKEESRLKARHTDTLSQNEIIKYSLMLLKEGGRLALILPADEGEQFLLKINFLVQAACKKVNNINIGGRLCEPILFPTRLCRVKTTVKKDYKRYLMEFELVGIVANRECAFSELVMMENGNYTKEYRDLTGDFYLNF